MKTKNQALCPLFPDVVCPQGPDVADACHIRQKGDYDPMSDFRDYLYMNCAVNQANKQYQSRRTQIIRKKKGNRG
jgi:hypothetical protein